MINHLESLEVQKLEQMAEANPAAFIERSDIILAELEDYEQKKHLLYLQGLAMVGQQRITEAENSMLELLSKAAIEGDYSLISKCNLVLSRCCKGTNKQSMERPYLKMAYESAKKAHDRYMMVECLFYLGAYFQAQKNKEKAFKYFTMAEKISRNIPDTWLQVKIRMDIGTAYYRFLQYDKSLAYLTSALDLCMQSDHVSKQLTIINNLATLYNVLNQYADAEKILIVGLEISKDKDYYQSRISLLFSMGVVAMRQDKHKAAIAFFENSLSLSNSIGFNNPNYQQEVYSNLAGCFRFIGDYTQAMKCLDKAESIVSEMSNPVLSNLMKVNKANLMLSMGQPKDAKKLLEKAIKHSIKHKQFEQHIVAQNNLAQCYEVMGDITKSLELLKELNNIYREYIDQVITDKTRYFDEQINQLIASQSHNRQAIPQQDGKKDPDAITDFVGSSPAIKKVMELAILASQHPSTNVFVTGESGTGKEIIAQFIHKNSVRRNNLFLPVNVSAISEGLVESEFFGHVKGAFTGALADKKGFFLAANHGTVYLDEIGDMPVELQAKLLRALESKKVTPVGSTTEIPFDCRIICSTNRNINAMIIKNQFRLDLLHRLNTLEIQIPPLHSRPDDIGVLTEYYVQHFAREIGRPTPLLKQSFYDRFQKYNFPGNVRELRNIIERLFIMNTSSCWDESALDAVLTTNLYKQPISGIFSDQEKDNIILALQKAEGKQKDAAKLLGISESTLTRRVAAYNLQSYTLRGK